MAPSEDQKLGSRRGFRIKLAGDKIDGVKKDHEGEQETQVPPDMAIRVSVS